MDLQTYGQLIFHKAGKNIQWKKDSLFNKWCWENCRRMKLDHFLTPFIKINSKGIKDLNVRQETIKTLEEKAGKHLSHFRGSNFLLDTAPKERGIKSKNELLGPHEDKIFCTTKETSTKLKGNQPNGKRYLQMTYQIKG